MSDFESIARLEREMGVVLESQRNIAESMKRIEAKMDERHKERFEFEVTVREHITVQGNYQELIEKHEDFIQLHAKPGIDAGKLNSAWINEIGKPAIEDIKRVKYMVAGAAFMAGTSMLSAWKEIVAFIKGIS
jgi:hypothetical protein